MKQAESLPIQTLRDLLDYDPDTGIMTWKPRTASMFPSDRTAKSWNTRYSGKRTAFFTNDWGYRLVSILKVKHVAHRVAWAIHYGDWPDGEIDHINRDGSDNRISNLRIATPTENARNKGEYANNTSGYRGVTWHKSSNKWMAQIKVCKRNVHLGLFSCPHEAGNAYKAAALEYYGREHG